MAKQKKERRQRSGQTVQKKELNFWMITTFVAVILLIGVTSKALFTSSESTTPITTIQPTTAQAVAIQPATSLASNSLEDQVRQVAVNFKCACGGCGELPLAECQCDMPKGAVEEKSFIRSKLNAGFSVQQVIDLVEKKYGLKVG